MNRRGFIGSLGLGAAGLLATSDFDWERLLWKPRPIITVPTLPGRFVARMHWADGTQTVWRNIPNEHPPDFFVDYDDHRDRTLDCFTVETDFMGKNISCVIPIHYPVKLRAGNTLTIQPADHLVDFSYA